MLRKGVTLIELIIALTIMSIVSMAVFMFFDVGYRVFDRTHYRAEVRIDLSKAISRMELSLHRASGITSATNHSLVYWIDENGNNVEDSGESMNIVFSGVSGEALVFSDSNGDTLLIDQVLDLTLTYDSVLVNSIRLVGISIRAVRGNEIITVRTKVRPRNIL